MLKTILSNIVEIVESKKAENIRSYDVSGNSFLTDYMLVIEGNNSIHVNSLLESLESSVGKLAKEDPENLYERAKVSGSAESGWIIVDLNAIIVHIMTEEKRDFYKIDEMFSEQGTVFHY